MKTDTYSLSVNLPSVEEFGERFPQYGDFAKHEGNFLFRRIVTPECYNNARIATLVFKLPAVAGVAEICYQSVLEYKTIEWRGFLKQFIGAVVCKLMEDNGFEKTGIKKSVPHVKFTKGEFYRPRKLK
jgi:hypothetical protein